jgi:hypothetical protein
VTVMVCHGPGTDYGLSAVLPLVECPERAVDRCITRWSFRLPGFAFMGQSTEELSVLDLVRLPWSPWVSAEQRQERSFAMFRYIR